MGARSRNLLGRCHSRSYRALYSSLLCKSISKATSRSSRLPNHRESPRDGERTMAQVLKMAKRIRSLRLLTYLPSYLNLSLPGDLIYLNVAGQPMVIINSPKVGVALLDRRTAIYSDRPRSIVACDIMTGGLFFAFSRYGDT